MNCFIVPFAPCFCQRAGPIAGGSVSKSSVTVEQSTRCWESRAVPVPGIKDWLLSRVPVVQRENSGKNILKEVRMPKYLIEREIPGAGAMSPQELQGVAEKSCSVLRDLGPRIQWVQSYVTDNKIYCVYIAPSEEMVREHASRGGFPANRISEIKKTIDPTTAESAGSR
jgi:Protein of unknown function (DUF4242)